MSGLLPQLSQALAATAEAAGASVVRVEGRDRLPATGLVWSADGLIVAAQHTLERDAVRVGLPDGGTAPARVAGRDPGVDLAVLRAEASGLQPAVWSEPESLRVGALVLALGRPGARVMATLGVISALDDSWRTPQGGLVDRFLQTDVVMFPGFSGGPLVDAAGQVAGLTSSGLVSGQSLALPLATVRETVNALLEHGRVRRGYLGVGAQPVELPEALQAAVGQAAGLLLLNVEPDGPAGRSGLMLGDTLVTLDGKPVRSLESLLAALGDEVVGRRIPARLVRGGQVREISVLVGERQG
jgi:S1-C subfamily serine protease